MYKTVLAITTLLLLAGCNTISPGPSQNTSLNFPPSEYILDNTAEHSNTTQYTFGQVKTVQLAQPMITYKKITKTVYDRTDVRFIAAKDVKVIYFGENSSDTLVYKLVKGKAYIPISSDETHQVFNIYLLPKGKTNAGVWVKVDKDGKVLENSAGKKLPESHIGEKLFKPIFTSVPPRPADIKPEQYFKQTLIYNGLEDGDIVIEYREYRDNKEVPIATELLKYKLSASNLIRHKKFKLEILYVDKEKIKFRTLAAPV